MLRLHLMEGEPKWAYICEWSVEQGAVWARLDSNKETKCGAWVSGEVIWAENGTSFFLEKYSF